MKILNTSKQTKRWALISLTLPLTLITFAQAESIQTCQAPVTIAEQGVVSKLRQGANKHRYLDVDINGVTAQAVIDTGGMGIGGLISQALLSDIGIDEKSMTEMTANGAHGASSAKRINIAKTKIANASVENLMFMSTEKNIMQDDNAPVLIGSRFLCQFLVGFNFSNNTLALYDRKTNVLDILEEPKQWSSFPFENFYGTGGIVFTMELNGKKVKAALDTGSPFTGVNWKAARLAGVEKNSKQLHQYEAVAHSLNATEATIVSETEFLLSLQGRQLERKDKEVRINDTHAFKQIFGDNPGIILGLPFFEKRRLVIDYTNKRLYIAES